MSSYKCMECAETSETLFVGGVCSSCGSLNIRNLQRKRLRKVDKHITDPKKSFLMLLLWGFVIYEVSTSF